MAHDTGSYVVAIITVGYLAFALQMWLSLRTVRELRKGAGAVIALVVVFVLCAITGYLSDFFPPEWMIYREGLHWALAGATLWLVFTNAAGAVASLMTMPADEIRAASSE